MRARRGERYYRARSVVRPELEEAAVVAFWEAGCLGVEVTCAAVRRGRPRVALSAFFPDHAGRAGLLTRLARALRGAGLDSSADARLETVGGGRWVEAWQRSLRPMAIGKRLLVVPQGCTLPRRGRRILIRVSFGQAFGTGEHASTRLALRLLESCLVPGDRVIDLGTGTGLLAMAACRLGAGRVIAVDDDPVALRVARANATLNRLGGRIEFRRADAARACLWGTFDLALVNIGATVIRRVLPHLAPALAPGGRAALAGLLVDDEDGLAREAATQGLEQVGRLRLRPWSALLLKRKPEHA